MARLALALAGALLLAQPAAAKVHETSPSGFVLRHVVDVPEPAERVWRVLVAPAQWWNGEHSFSGDAANLSLEARAGGCFCEVLPNPVSPNAAPRGSAEHMRVIYVEQPRALRMTGALGPLQSGAGTGTLTIFLRPAGDGTRILWEYVYGGYVRGDVQTLAASVDRVLGEQLLGLAGKLGLPVPPGGEAAPEDAGRQDESDFVSEMAAGIEQAAPAEPRASPPAPATLDAPVTLPDSQGFDKAPPRRNDQGFIGR